jgi:CheY-like chemotaxis protein
MAALALISDLVMQSQLTAAAARSGVDVTIAATEDALVAKAESARSKLVIVDLSHPGLDPRALAERLKPLVDPEATLLAFGPHVHVERLAAAAEAGFGVVLSRGKFHAEMSELLKQYG